MAVTLNLTEGVPAAWPDVPGHEGEDLDAVWQRIEGWIAHRWRSRSVVYVVEGPGEWCPRLTPFTASSTEQWNGSAWVAGELAAAPLGYVVPAGKYRITGTAGDASTPPPAVLKAVSQLAEYMAGSEKHPGASAFKTGLATIDLEEQRSPAWLTKALAYSGAADLLRPYRGLA